MEKVTSILAIILQKNKMSKNKDNKKLKQTQIVSKTIL